MAIAKVSHIRLVGPRRDQNKTIDVLTQNGAFEVRETDELSVALERGNGGSRHDIKLKQDKISFAMGFLKARHAAMESMLDKKKREAAKDEKDAVETDVYELSKEKYSDARILITHADFSDAAAKELDLMHVCDELQKISFEIVDTESKKTSLINLSREYAPYCASPLNLSRLEQDGGITVSLYYNRAAVDCGELLDTADCAYDVRRTGGGMLLTVVSRAAATAELDKALAAVGFSKCPYRDDMTASEVIESLADKQRDLDTAVFELTKKALGYEKYLKELRILYDVFELDIERAEADEGFLKTDSAFVLEGWVPEQYADAIIAELESACPNIFVQLLAPEDRDAPPSLVVNNNVVKPYEEITNMYSAPHYREIDPNPIMAIFYFIFFGLMIGDAAYGLVLAVGGFILGLSKKFDKGAKNVLLLVGMGGISAVIWGILFGGYFAIDFGDLDIALWFNPIDDPMTMLILSIALGCIQMTVGYIIKFIRLCSEKKVLDAFFDPFPIILIFGAIAFLACSMMIEGAPAWLTTAAIALGGSGLALIIIFGGRNNKNVFGKVFGGFKGVYGLVNLLSDVLSYCRLFGLGLASGAIGLAFNTLGSILFGIPGIGYVVGVIVLIPLHAFNIGIGVLGAYVHNARLQFLEFYGKFYDGGGRLFEPLGGRTRYVRFD